MTHNRRNPNPRDRDLEAFARQPKPSLRLPPEERQRWRSVDRSLRSAFEPRRRDDAELRQYFAQGPNPSFRGRTPEQRKTWARVHRCLEGGGFHLQLHYTGGQARDHHLELCAEYRHYLQNTAKSYAAACWTPYVVVTDRCLRAFMKRLRPAHEIVTARDWYRGCYLIQKPRGPEAPDALRSIPRSTWGDRLVDASSARFLLELAGRLSVVEGRRMSDAGALEALADELGNDGLFRLEQLGVKLPDEEGRTPPGLRTTAGQQRAKRDAMRAVVAFAESAPDLSILGDLVKFDNEWDPTKIVVDPERPTTTLTEIAEGFGLDTQWVKRALLKHSCQEARVTRRPIPTAWLRSDRGRDFWADAEAEIERRGGLKLLTSSTRFCRPRRRV